MSDSDFLLLQIQTCRGNEGQEEAMKFSDSHSPELLNSKCHNNFNFEAASISISPTVNHASSSFELPQLQLLQEEEAEGDYEKLLIVYKSQKKDLEDMRTMLYQLKAQNQTKTRECREASNSLNQLRNELMRKSMHVGSLAFAIEGQVKEKTKWFSTLRDLTTKLKIMKLENIKLAEEVSSSYKFFLAELNDIHSTITQQSYLNEHLKTKFVQGVNERKQLYNKVLELKGNIRVFCRCRPLNNEEITSGASLVVDFESAKDGELTVKSNGFGKKSFKFDAVFCPQTGQADVFKDTAPFATSVLDGYNVCVFAYGQTGTGKTFTMEGTEEARGVNFRILEELFCMIRERQKLYQYSVSVSVLEVYNEQIRDLLATGTQPAVTTKRLEVRQVSEGIHHVPGLVEAPVSNMTQVWDVLQTGSNARAVSSTNANEHSSRSHCMHCVMVKGENLLNGECTRSKLWLVDLAGSERIAKTEVQGERLRETQNINRSLSALGDVISALSTKSPHIPFRNSKLTHLLQDSLGGDSKTLMFVQISPNERDLGETICSLNFASRVRGVELGPAKKQLDAAEYLRYKQLAEKTKLDIKSKDLQMKKMEETIHGFELKVKEKDLKNKNLQDKVKELESQLLVERKLARQHVDTKIAEQQMKNQQEEQNVAPIRSPLGNRTLKNVSDALVKDQLNSIQPLFEKKSYKVQVGFRPMNEFVKYIDPTEKENNPEMVEQSFLPRRSGRASICPMTSRPPAPAACAPRRNSLIPFLSTPNTAQIPLQFLPLAPIAAAVDEKDDSEDEREANCLPKQTSCDSPKVITNGARKLSSILRRSIHKKVQTRSPKMMMQQQGKRGVNVGGTEKVRVSIGSRWKLLSNPRRPGGVGVKSMMQKQQTHKDKKERGWNVGRAIT